MQIVPLKGSPAVISALRGGQVDAAVEIMGPVLTHINAQTLHALAITGKQRSAALPDVPTASESWLRS